MLPRTAGTSLWLAALGILCLCGGGVVSQEGSARVVDGLEFTPAPSVQDAGPETLIGATPDHPEGKSFLWVDVLIEGDAPQARVYFDRLDNENYHFLQRRGGELTLGLREAGAEQVFCRAALPEDDPAPLRLARHGANIGVFHGLRLLAAAFDERRLGGSVGLRSGGGPTPLKLRAEARDEIRFADDFMREKNESSLWRQVPEDPTEPHFAIRSLRNPSMSANAFNYMGKGPGVMSVTGGPWWDNYRYEVSLRGPESAKIGLVFAFQNEKNYGLFRWTARPLSPDGATAGPGLGEFVRVQDGKEEVLGKLDTGYLPNQWYRGEVSVTYGRVRLTLDGQPLFEFHEPVLAAGAVGVWCDVPRPQQPATDPRAQPSIRNSLHDLMCQHAVFDDVKVSSLESLEDDFREPGALAHGWLTGLGRWTVLSAQPGRPGVLEVLPGDQPSKSLIGSRRWSQYRLACDVFPGGGTGGLVFLYEDEGNHFLAQTDGRTLSLVRVAAGSAKVLEQARLSPAGLKGDGGFIRLSASIREGHVKVTAAGGTSVEGLDLKGDASGRCGLLAAPSPASAAPRVCFRRLRLLFTEDPEPLVSTNAIFDDEESMRHWNCGMREWQPAAARLLLPGCSLLPAWHSGQFPGDIEVTVEPRDLTQPRHAVALGAGCVDEDLRTGYAFLCRAETADGARVPGLRLELLRKGQPAASLLLPPERLSAGGPSSLGLRRAGRYVVGKVNGQPALFFRDAEPLAGTHVAYASEGAAVRAESAKIHSNAFLNEQFARAPADWRTAGCAIAEVTNRWQCDPRWSFFSLKNDVDRGKPAVLWSKRLLPGDVTLEFYVGYKMETARGTPYTYARDINITLCSDGRNLAQGYTFMLGGKNNTGTFLLRNGEVVKSLPRVLPTSTAVHHAWFVIRVEKRGPRLSLHVDRVPGLTPFTLEFDDREPLTGDRLALWTYDDALMFGRVLISGIAARDFEPLDQELPALKTPYDLPDFDLGPKKGL